MSPAPHAPCRGQHCPVVAMLLAPRSNPLPIPEKTGWVGPCRFQMAETTCQPQFEAPHHLEWLIRRPSASSIWGRMRFFAGRPVRSWRRVLRFAVPPRPSGACSEGVCTRLGGFPVPRRKAHGRGASARQPEKSPASWLPAFASSGWQRRLSSAAEVAPALLSLLLGRFSL